ESSQSLGGNHCVKDDFRRQGVMPLARLPRRLAPLPCRIIVGIGSLLLRPDFLRDVTQVDADARPRRRPPADRIDQNIIDREVFGSSEMFGFPAFEPGESSVLAR